METDLLDSAIVEVMDIAKKLDAVAPRDNEVYHWLGEFFSLGMLEMQAEYTDGVYVPSGAMTNLLCRGRLIVERLYPAKTEPCNTIEECEE